MKIGNREFKTTGHTYIMGILNVTPDSFSDGGLHYGEDEALRHAYRMVKEGADIIDIGGESTRPGYEKVSDDEEIYRVVPVIDKIKSELDIPISVDTYKPVVAAAAISAGADLINDVWGLQTEGMAELIAKHDLPCCLMHNRKEGNIYEPDLKTAIIHDMSEIIWRARKAGIPGDKIIIDPGIGFAKDTEQNLMVLNDENFMMPAGFPILLGTSRKSVIGNVLDVPVSERLEGTLATTAVAIQRNCMFVRVHDVLANARFIKMMEAIRNCK